MSATSAQQPEFLTRAEVPKFLAQHGFPIGRSTIDKLSMPSRGEHAAEAGWRLGKPPPVPAGAGLEMGAKPLPLVGSP